MSRYEKKSKDKLEDEIKLAGLEALVPEELEKQLILNSNRLRTFEDARLEMVTYVQARFGSRIRDSKPSDTGSRGHSDPIDVGAVNSLSLFRQRKRGIRSARWVSAGEHIFNETAMHARAQANNRLARANRARHGPRVRAKDRVNKTRENPKESTKGPKVRSKEPKAHTMLKYRELVSQVWKTRNQRQAGKLRNRHRRVPLSIHGFMIDGVLTKWNDGWSYDEWNDDWSLVGWHEGCEQLYDNSASSFSLGSLALGAMSSPKRFEWVKMNLDTGAVNSFT